MDEQGVRAVIDIAHEAFIAMDSSGRITYWNPQAAITFGWDSDEVVGRMLAETIIPSSLRQAHTQGLAHYLATGAGPVLDTRIEVNALHRDGHEFPVELTISAVEADGQRFFSAFLHDITDRKVLEYYLLTGREVTSILAGSESVVDSIPEVLRALGEGMGWEIGHSWGVDRDRGVLVPRHSWFAEGLDVAGWKDTVRRTAFERGVGLPGRVWESGEIAWIEDVREDPNFPRASAARQLGLRAAIAVPIVSGGEVTGVIELFSRDPKPHDERLVGLMRTLGAQIGGYLERAELVARLEAMARTDQLTGLPNRRAWEEELLRERARAERRASFLSVAILDIDHFKAFNDEHGHPSGDAVLRDAAAAWRLVLRVTDFIARHGGEEFALLLPDCPLADAVAATERLCAAMPPGPTCSAGVACWDGQERADELVARADACLYEAKRAGRDRVIAAGVDSGLS